MSTYPPYATPLDTALLRRPDDASREVAGFFGRALCGERRKTVVGA